MTAADEETIQRARRGCLAFWSARAAIAGGEGGPELLEQARAALADDALALAAFDRSAAREKAAA